MLDIWETGMQVVVRIQVVERATRLPERIYTDYHEAGF